ncbi:hypothetical protein LQW54_009775 [Pestalotiopsis sp. IQ-011]
MKFTTSSSLALLWSLGQAQQCPTGSGVGMIVARASTEAPGTGIIGSVADDVAAQMPGSTITAVDYPATLENYQSSEGTGVAAMTELVQNFTTSCPESKMVLMGYSQGAQVTMDLLCGTSETGFAATSAVPSDNVAAVVLMGDPSFTPNQTFNAGTATNPGVHLSYVQTNGPDATKFILSNVQGAA